MKENKTKQKTKKEEYDTYTVPIGVQDVFNKYDAYWELREKYIKENKSYRKIKKMAAKAEHYRSKFWVQIGRIYPDMKYPTKTHNLYYVQKKGILEVRPKEPKND